MLCFLARDTRLLWPPFVFALSFVSLFGAFSGLTVAKGYCAVVFAVTDVTSTNRNVFRDGHVTDVTVTFFVTDVTVTFFVMDV